MKNKIETKETPKPPEWTFLSNHSHVLICLYRDSEMRLRDVADMVGITERAVQAIVKDLVTAGILERIKDGRRNKYTINLTHPLRHPLEAHHNISQLLKLGK